MSRVKATVLSDASAEPIVSAVLPAFAAAAGISAEDAQRLAAVGTCLVEFTLDDAYPDDDAGEIEVTPAAGGGGGGPAPGPAPPPAAGPPTGRPSEAGLGRDAPAGGRAGAPQRRRST